MENLAQELIDHISIYLDRYDLRATLTVNSKFQAAAERLCGAFESFELSERSVDMFLKTFSGRHFRHLRRVYFATALVPNDFPPKYTWGDPSTVDEDDLPLCRETKKALNEYDESFTEQITFLFQTLSTVEHAVHGTYGPGNISLTILTPTMELDPSIFCPHRAFVSWRVRIKDPGTLPTLTSVRRLRIENGAKFKPFERDPRITLRKIELRVLLDLSYKFPKLEHLACGIGGDEWPTPLSEEVTSHLYHVYQGPRRDARHEFANCVDLSSLPVNLRDVALNFIAPYSHLRYIDQGIPMPNLESPYLYDPFSTSLRISSYLLRRMCLFAVVDKTLFWPVDDNETPSWPHLEIIDVCFHIVSPSGKWYFQGLQGETCMSGYELDDSAYPPLETTVDDEDWCDRIDYIDTNVTNPAQFRVMPNNHTISPLLEAFAKATDCMPQLKEAVIWCPLYFDDRHMQETSGDDIVSELTQGIPSNLAWGIAYTRPYEPAFSDSDDEQVTASRQLWWFVGNKWRPDSKLHKLFQKIGSQKHGKDLVEHWEHPYYGDGLVEDGVFERHRQRLFPNFGEFERPQRPLFPDFKDFWN